MNFKKIVSRSLQEFNKSHYHNKSLSLIRGNNKKTHVKNTSKLFHFFSPPKQNITTDLKNMTSSNYFYTLPNNNENKEEGYAILATSSNKSPLSYKKIQMKRLPFIQTSNNWNIRKEYNNNPLDTLDSNLDSLKFCYQVTSDKIVDDKDKKVNEEIKNKFLQNSKVSKDESMLITNFLQKNKKYEKPTVEVLNSYYTDPKSSLHFLKVNKAIQSEYRHLISKTQTFLYNEEYENYAKKRLQIKLMPKTKVTKIPPKESELLNLAKDKGMKDENTMVDELVREKILKDNIYYHCFVLRQNNTVPNSRIQFTMTPLNDIMPGKILIFGGLCSYPLFDFWLYNVKKMTWQKLVPKNIDNFNNRYGHSAVYYQGCIYFYGGNLIKKPVNPIDDILIYNINKNSLKEGVFKKNRLKMFRRKNHIAEVINGLMIVHGGVRVEENESHLYDGRQEILCSVMTLDLNTFRWERLYIEYKNFIGGKKTRVQRKEINIHNNQVYDVKAFELKLAKHSSCLVISKENLLKESLNIFHFDNFYNDEEPSSYVKNAKLERKIRFEGIYIFGGYDDFEELNGDLAILHFGRSPLVFYRPNTDGKKPTPRHSCSMNYFSDLNCIVIYGGWNTITLCDMFLFDVITLNWIEVQLFGGDCPPRAEHSSAVIGNKLIIFGGSNENNILPAKIFTIDLDIYANKKKKQLFDRANENLIYCPRDKNIAKILNSLKNDERIPDEY